MRSALRSLRRPSYTGERRCWPCTVLNVGVLAVVCGALGLFNPVLAVGVALGGVSAIALRGYLVPGTPRFAPRLAAHLPGRFVGMAATDSRDGDIAEAPTRADSLGVDEPVGERVLDALVERGVLIDDGEALHLDSRVREDWREEMATLRAFDSQTLADIALENVPEADDAELVHEREREWVVLTAETGSFGAERWLSRPIAIAEVAAVRTLAADLSLETCIAAAHPLRMFLERCPVCEGSLERTTAAACCGGPGPNGPEEVLACAACEQRLFTF